MGTAKSEQGGSDALVFPIVGIGASAGGLNAARTFLQNTPPDSGMAFVLVFHLDPKHKSEVAELLQGHTPMPVAQVVGPTRVEPDHVYVIPPNHSLALTEGQLVLGKLRHADGRPTVIDHFFRSLAGQAGEHAIGVVLSGTGTEGSQGLKAIKEAGGLTVVQDETEAEYAGMPHSAITTGLVDFVLPVAAMPAKLLEAKNFAVDFALPDHDRAAGDSDTEILQKIFVQLRSHVGNDFSHYKQNTILRRITRRMQVHQLKGLEEYLKLLRNDTAEIEALFRELLISVTNFFRDPEAMAVVQREVIPQLCKRAEGQTVRVWVPGCATGEEAYSLAMLLSEACDGLATPPRLQIFASDVDERALDIARRGVYPDAVAGDISEARLKRYFERDGNDFVVRASLRELILFTRHDLLRDPPFSRLDLISCRNLLIYLKSEVQARVFELFHFALKRESWLFLGGSESLGGSGRLFTELDRKAKVFQSRRVPGAELHIPLLPGSLRDVTKQRKRDTAGKTFAEIARDELLGRYAPPCVIVDDSYNVSYISGRVGKFLEPGAGAANYNILDMAREGLRLELRTALYRALHAGEATRGKHLQVRTNGSTTPIALTVQPLPEADGYLMVVFEELAADAVAPEPPRGDIDDGVVAELEAELTNTRESLQTSIEELETSNEELRASNEELQSMNEELQSTTEELETGKEELQSANEELLAVNQELQGKNDELARTNSDLNNFIVSTDIGTLFLDPELKVRRYTPRMADIFNLIPGDIGRPLAHLTSNLVGGDLIGDAGRVMADLAPLEREVGTVSDRCYQVRLRPYRDVDNKIGGVVLTFVDVTERRRHEAETQELNARLELQKAYAENVIDTVNEPMLVLDGELRVVSANRSFYRAFRTAPEFTEHMMLYELGARQWDVPELRRLLEEILPEHTTVEGFEVRHDFGSGERSMSLNARRLRQGPDDQPLILLVFDDVTDRQRSARDLLRLASIVSSSDDAIISKDLEGTIVTWNAGAVRMFGYRAEEAVGRNILDLIIPEDRVDEEADILGKLRCGETIHHFETLRHHQDGHLIPVSETISPLLDNGRVVGASKIVRDISVRRNHDRHRELLLNELNHRVKNTLASVQALATQTFRGTKVEAQLEAFEERLLALSAAHDVLTLENWGGAGLRSVVAGTVRAWGGGGKTPRIRVHGPDIRLRPAAALALSMALHELATNAVKYGALSNQRGTVTIQWQISADDPPRLGLRWEEHGGPAVSAPSQRGFGSRLIEKGLARDLGGTVQLIFDKEGLKCVIDAPLDEMLEIGGGGVSYE